MTYQFNCADNEITFSGIDPNAEVTITNNCTTLYTHGTCTNCTEGVTLPLVITIDGSSNITIKPTANKVIDSIASGDVTYSFGASEIDQAYTVNADNSITFPASVTDGDLYIWTSVQFTVVLENCNGNIVYIVENASGEASIDDYDTSVDSSIDGCKSLSPLTLTVENGIIKYCEDGDCTCIVSLCDTSLLCDLVTELANEKTYERLIAYNVLNYINSLSGCLTCQELEDLWLYVSNGSNTTTTNCGCGT